MKSIRHVIVAIFSMTTMTRAWVLAPPPRGSTMGLLGVGFQTLTVFRPGRLGVLIGSKEPIPAMHAVSKCEQKLSLKILS